MFFYEKILHKKKSIKSIKSIKIRKTQISEQVTFLSLDVFYVHENAAFFVFVCLYAFYAFLCEENFLVKKKKSFKLPLYPHLLYYWRVSPSTCLWRNIFLIFFFFITIFFSLSQSFFIVTIFFNYHNLFQLSQSFLSQSLLIITIFLNLFTACNTIFMKISQRMNFIV